MSLNRVLLIGNLGRDPEVRFTPSGRAVARFPLATSEVWTDQEGQRQERTEWHNVVVWGKQAESCGQYHAKDGNKRYITEVIAQRVQFLGGGSRGAEVARGASGTPEEAAAPVAAEEDDIPF